MHDIVYEVGTGLSVLINHGCMQCLDFQGVFQEGSNLCISNFVKDNYCASYIYYDNHKI